VTLRLASLAQGGSAVADVVIVGGSVVGCSVAWHLRRDGFTGRIVVVERDHTYQRASAFRAMGGIRQQFCTPVTVQMVQYSVSLWKEFDERLQTTSHRPRASFRQRGYLFLANQAIAAQLMRRFELERRAGAVVQLLARDDLGQLVPDLVLDDIVFGVLGPEDGYANPREVLAGFRHAVEPEVDFVDAEVTGIEQRSGRVTGITLSDNRTITTPLVVNAAGAWGGRVARLAGLDVPIDPVKQELFRATLPREWPRRFPMVIDPGGVHWRHEDPAAPGDPDRIIVAFTNWDQPIGETFECDANRWRREFEPALLARVPSFRGLHSVEGWAGLYEMTPDHNPVLGAHPALSGFIFANGFSGHGLMMSPATGKIVSEIVRTGRSETFDVRIFAPDRFDRGALVHDEATI
jgi:FAD-dependent oxidoreductase domain-containing protein 1